MNATPEAQNPAVELLVFERAGTDRPPQLASTIPLRGRTELGRQESTAEALYSSTWRDADKYWRVVIARGTEQTIGRHHAVVELLADGRVQLTNTSRRPKTFFDPRYNRDFITMSARPASGSR